MSCDELQVRVGDLGLFQLIYLIVMGITKLFCGVHIFVPIFAAYRRPYWCSSWGNLSQVAFNCSPATEFNTTKTCMDSDWKFDDSIVSTTIQSQYGLVCDREMFVPMSTTFFMGGFLVGCTLYGFLSDRFGRSKMSSYVSLHALIVSILTPLAPSLQWYILGRFLIGISVGGILTIANTSCVEILTAQWRYLGLAVASSLWIVGNLSMLVAAYLQRNHVYLQLIGALFAVPGLFTYFIIPEPLRWLVVNKHIEKAYEVAQKMARINKKDPLTRKEFDIFYNKCDTESANKVSDNKCLAQFQFLKYKHMRRITVITWFLFAATSFVSYSFTFSIGRFDDNIYRNVLIMSVTSPIYYITVYILNRFFGRVKIMIASYAIGSILTFVLIAFYKVEYYAHFAIWIAFVAQFCLGVDFFFIWLYAIEVYPTQFRTSAVGSCSTLARLGSLLSPQVIYLDLIWRPFPFIIYGTVGCMCTFLAIFLPETKGIATLETITDGELFAKHNRLWRKRWIPNDKVEEKELDSMLRVNQPEESI